MRQVGSATLSGLESHHPFPEEPSSDAQERLDLLDDAAPLVPLGTATAELDSDPERILELGTSDEVLTAGHNLVEHYGETCLSGPQGSDSEPRIRSPGAPAD